MMKPYPQFSDGSPSIETAGVVEPETQQTLACGRQRWGIAVSCLSYPIIGLAIWIGVGRGLWSLSAIIAALAVVMSFIGWDVYNQAVREDQDLADPSVRSAQSSELQSLVALGARLLAVAVPIYSYSVVATAYGLPMPQTPLGWIVSSSVIVSVAFALLRTES
jgi:hypothetical protein